MQQNSFRYDINGLRAIAVIAVVLFHFNAAWLPGGFAGVDVFFVISGFLMTGIIFKGIEQEKFSILKFYVARANRIIPALAVLCLILLIFGWFYLSPLEFKALGKHSATSITFLSNIIYWQEAGYFDSASHTKWLLHTWSLSVEWQFYILYPLVLVCLRQFFSIRTMKSILLGATLLGFIVCIIATYKWPNPSYYLLPTRAWEMMIGGLAFLYPFKIKENRKKIIEWLGLALIVGSYIFISAENLWPGYLALFPVIGAFLVIQAHRHDSIMTNNPVFQKLGTWSYSIYLWHWPFVVAIYSFSLPEYYIYLGLILSVISGFLSYRYIEKIKFRNDFSSPLSYLKSKPIYIVIIIGLMGTSTFMTQGFLSHYSNDIAIVAHEANNKNPYQCMTENKFPCYLGNKNNIKAIIVGDSHADALTTSLASVFNLKTEGIIALTKQSCPLVLGIKSLETGDECLKENVKRMAFLNSEYPHTPVFWVARTGAYLYGQNEPARINTIKDTQPSIYFSKQDSIADNDLLHEFEDHLNKTVQNLTLNRKVYLVLPIPEMGKNIPKTLTKALSSGHGNIDLSLKYSSYLDRNKPLIQVMENISKNNHIELLDPTPYLCKTGKCIATHQGRPIYYDADHMSEYGNKLLSNMFRLAMYNAQ